MISLSCKRCATPIPFPVTDEKEIECPKCGLIRRLYWFSGPRAWDRWFAWAVFEQPKIQEREVRPR
jgi:hypothetical protein